MPAAVRTLLQATTFLFLLFALVCVGRRAAAQPPTSGSVAQPAQRPRGRAVVMTRAPTPAPSVLERFGGVHAARALRVAQGLPAGRVALRPMFWVTRDQRGAMFALGGRF